MKRTLSFLAVLSLSGCITFSPKPVHINSDPNQEALERLEEKNAEDNLSAFIIDHPELDDRTKKDLRDGTISAIATPTREWVMLSTRA